MLRQSLYKLMSNLRFRKKTNLQRLHVARFAAVSVCDSFYVSRIYLCLSALKFLQVGR